MPSSHRSVFTIAYLKTISASPNFTMISRHLKQHLKFCLAQNALTQKCGLLKQHVEFYTYKNIGMVNRGKSKHTIEDGN